MQKWNKILAPIFALPCLFRTGLSITSIQGHGNKSFEIGMKNNDRDFCVFCEKNKIGAAATIN